jgi:hypothetical protein
LSAEKAFRQRRQRDLDLATQMAELEGRDRQTFHHSRRSSTG